MNTFYKIDSTRVSFREYLWWHKSPLVIIPWMMKLFRVPTDCSSDDPNCESTLPCVAEGLPAEIAPGFEPLAAELDALGFRDPVYHVIHDDGSRTTIYWATFRHESGNHFARIHQRLWHQAQMSNRGLFPMFFTAFTDGTFLVSSSGKPDMAAPKTVIMNRMYRAPVGRLWQKHQQLLEKASERKLISPVRSPDDLIQLTERHHVLVRDFHVARGVFHVRTEAEQAQADSFAATVAQAQASGLENAEVLAELQRLQEQKPGWGATIPILIVSLLLFVVVGVARWNWKYTLMIIPVLLFHESGHWAAMRVFHYRNLRMFFIPFFGAAVSGRNWNVAGWKKALVALAGPLPGIALGMFLGVAGMAWKQPLLAYAAFLLIFINGFNLLPFLPMDGGRVLHTILFCRNRWLDVVFRVLAIGGLLLLSIVGSKILLYVAIAMAVTLPLSFKLARITDNLRKKELPEPQPDEDRIPVPTAQAIIAEVKAAFPAKVKMSNKAIAQHTLNVFETLNARPPGALGTIGLMTIQGGALLLAVVFGLLFAIGQYGGFGDFAQAALRQPRHAFKRGEVQQWQGAQAAASAGLPHNLLVATFKRPEQASAEFGQITPQLPANSRLTLFGESLLLSLPASDDAAREKWFDQLQAATTNLLEAVSNQPVFVNLLCIPPTLTVATNLSLDLEDYFAAAPAMHLVPPWSAEYQTPKFVDERYARGVWRRINLAVSRTSTNAAMKSSFEKIAEAERREARSEIAQLEAGREQLQARLQTEAREQFRAHATNAIVPVLVDLNAALAKVESTNEVARAALLRQIAGQLGEVKYDGDKPAPEADAPGASGGAVSRHGLMLELSWVQMNDATIGLPALASWLCDQNCTGFKYDLFDGSNDE
jgi:Zn-dependent protease